VLAELCSPTLEAQREKMDMLRLPSRHKVINGKPTSELMIHKVKYRYCHQSQHSASIAEV
jgi:hypothetical protein